MNYLDIVIYFHLIHCLLHQYKHIHYHIMYLYIDPHNLFQPTPLLLEPLLLWTGL